MTNLEYMFGRILLNELDISHFDTSKALSMESMFSGAGRLSKLNLSSFRLKYAAKLQSMLRSNANIERVNLGKWDPIASIANVDDNFTGNGWDGPENMPVVYCEAGTEPTEDITCETPPMIVTFETTSAQESVSLGVSGGNINVIWGDGGTDNNTAHEYAEAGVYEVWIENSNTLTEINNSWSDNLIKVNSLGDISNVTTFTHPFKNKPNLKLFSGYSKLNDGVTDLSSMFEGATNLERVDLSQFSPSNVTNTSNMFKGAASLKIVNLGEINQEV